LDSEEEEPVLNFLSYMFQANTSGHAQSDPIVSSGSNTVELRTHANMTPQPDKGRVDAEHIGNTDWQAIMGSQTHFLNLKLNKSDFVDYSALGWAFRLKEASKNIHELDPSIIPSALKQMAHCRVFIPLKFTTQSLQTIRVNVGDLYTKKKTRLCAGK